MRLRPLPEANEKNYGTEFTKKKTWYTGYTEVWMMDKVLRTYRIQAMVPTVYGSLGLLLYMEVRLKDRLIVDLFFPESLELFSFDEQTQNQIGDLHRLLSEEHVLSNKNNGLTYQGSVELEKILDHRKDR